MTYCISLSLSQLAMENFREHLSPLSVAFIAASDDSKWLEENLGSEESVFISGMRMEEEKRNSFNSNDRNIESAIFDMILLANCNHSIMG